jgi:CheY-like chemotaxis protein
MSTVLLVDDDLENLWALQLALESEGRRVLLAESARDALDKLAREPTNLMVTDLEMPGMDGAELCKRVRCQPAFAHLPIVLMSAADEPVDRQRCWSKFFRKPADLTVLIRALDSFLAERLTSASVSYAGMDLPASRWRPIDSRCWP